MIQVPNKIGFHTGPGGNPTGLGDWMRALDKARIPFCLKSVDHYGTIFEAQELMKVSDVPHVLIFRLVRNDEYDYDVPPYKDPKYANDPEGGAEYHWAKTLAKLPPEFDRERVWLEPINEVDKDLCDWLGRFAVRTADLAQQEGMKVTLFAWSSGEPEPQGWETPGMLAYLRLCAERPQQAAVSLHEYSYVEADIFDQFPFKIGRIQYLFSTADKHNIPRPRVHITEWGWTLNSVAVPEKAIPDIRKVGELYARFPEVEGAAIWYLGPGFEGIADKAQKLIKPVTDFTLTEKFEVEESSAVIDELPPIGDWQQYGDDDMSCDPRVPYARKYLIAPQDATLARWLEICAAAFAGRNTVSFSNDDGGHAPGVSSNENVLYDIPADKQAEFLAWYEENYPETAVSFADGQPAPTPPAAKIALVYRPCDTQFINQYFGANPQNYPLTPGHEGLDYAVVKNAPFYAAAPGTVVHASDRRWSSDAASDYGWHVVIQHEGGYATVYAHARPDLPVVVGQQVAAGEIVGYSGNTGKTTGYHEHFTLLDQTGTIDPNNGYPTWTYGRPVDPWPFVEGKPAPVQPAPAPSPTLKYSGPAVTFAPALHQPGSDWMWQQGNIQGMFSLLNIPVKWLSDGVNSDYFTQFNRPQFHLVRLNWKTSTYKTPAEAWAEIRDGALRFYGKGARKFEALNEPNLPQEGLGIAWPDGDAFGRWLADLIVLAKAEMPDAKFYFPGMSPGVPWTNQFSFTDKAWPHVAQHCYGFCLHAYTGITNDAMSAAADIVKQVKEAQNYKWLDRPLVVSEASVNRAPDGATNAEIAAYKAAVYRGVEKELVMVPGIEAVCWFVSHWNAPPEQQAHKESWLEIGLAEVYKG